MMSSRLIGLLVVAITSSFSAQATDNNAVNATIVYGADSNPHKLSKGLKPDEITNFIKGEFKLRQKLFDHVYVHANINKSQYDDDPRADEFKASARITVRDRFRIAKSKFKYRISANYRVKDKTYVSKLTGLVATNEGQSIADRYDSEQITYLAKLTHIPNKFIDYSVSYEKRDKTYEAFEIPGLSNLDYAHQKVTMGFEYKSSDLGRYYMNGAFRQREYLDKRAKDIEGTTILNSDLVYNYSTLNLGYIYRPNNDVRWRYTYHYEERRDTTSGFYNATTGYIAMSAIHRISDYQYLRARLKYSKFSLINQSEVDPITLDEDNHEKQGVSAMIGYEWILATLYDTNLAVYVELEHSNFENTDPTYSYEKSKAALGIRWSAF